MVKLLIFFFLMACSKDHQVDMKNLVFIQGLHLDAKAWKEVTEYIDPDFYRVIDLGRVERDKNSAASLTTIAQQSCKKIPSKSILVVHDFGGAIVNQMAGICPEKMRKIIYVTAHVPLKDEKPFDRLNKKDQINYSNTVTFTETKIIPNNPAEFYPSTDASIGPKEDLPPLYSEWPSLNDEQIKFDAVTFGNIPKAYIFTENDNIISLETQQEYVEKAGIKMTRNLQVGHLPLISNPKALAILIIELADRN